MKNASVSAEKFLAGVQQGAAEGKSHKEIAAELGMKVPSFSVRLSQYRKICEAAGVSFPSFGNRGTKKDTVVNLASEIFGRLAGLEPLASEQTDTLPNSDEDKQDTTLGEIE